MNCGCGSPTKTLTVQCYFPWNVENGNQGRMGTLRNHYPVAATRRLLHKELSWECLISISYAISSILVGTIVEFIFYQVDFNGSSYNSSESKRPTKKATIQQ